MNINKSQQQLISVRDKIQLMNRFYSLDQDNYKDVIELIDLLLEDCKENYFNHEKLIAVTEEMIEGLKSLVES